MDIDPATGLIAVESCPVIRTKTFTLGTEPKKYCGPEYHQGKVIEVAPPGRPQLSARRSVKSFCVVQRGVQRFDCEGGGVVFSRRQTANRLDQITFSYLLASLTFFP